MRVPCWLVVLRRFFAGAVLLYVAVVLTLGGTTAARPVLYGLTGLWLAVLLWRPLFVHKPHWRGLAFFLPSPRLRGEGPGVRGEPSGHCGAFPSPPTPLPASGERGEKRCAHPQQDFLSKASWPAWLEIAVTNLALTLVLSEMALRGFAACTGSAWLTNSTLDAYRLRPGHDYGGGLIGNRLGYPGSELSATHTPGVLRVAALGDSFAVGPAVPFADNYLTRLAEQTGIQVGNFGVAGAGPREYRAILERDVWAVQPDLVLVSVFVGNDITETLAHPRHLDPAGHALYVFGRRLGRLVRERCRVLDTLTAPTFDRLARLTLSPQTFREVEARRLAVCVQPTSPALEKKWRLCLRELERLVSSCRQHGVPVMVVLIPDEFQTNSTVLTAALQEAGLTRAQIDLELPQRRLLAFCAQQGVPCLDLLPALRAAGDAYAPCDTHWNVRGNRIAAEQLAGWLPTAAARPAGK